MSARSAIMALKMICCPSRDGKKYKSPNCLLGKLAPTNRSDGAIALDVEATVPKFGDGSRPRSRQVQGAAGGGTVVPQRRVYGVCDTVLSGRKPATAGCR